jgi:hypothetical protein
MQFLKTTKGINGSDAVGQKSLIFKNNKNI